MAPSTAHAPPKQVSQTRCVGVAAYCLHAAKATPAQRVWLTCFGGAWAVLGAIRAVV